MANQLTLTNTPYLYCISLGSTFSANTPYTIVPADNTHDRRIYGLSITNTSSVNHNNCKLWLSDGTTDYQMGLVSILANAGNSISVGANDVFTNSVFSGLLTFAMADDMGVWYFNLPKGWSLKFTFTNTLSSGNLMTFTTFGEKYDGVSMKFTSTPFQQTATYSSTTGTRTVNLVPSAAYDRRIYAISAASTDVTARAMNFGLTNSGTNYLIYTDNIVANAGNTTTLAAGDYFYEALIQGLFVRTADAEGISYYFNLPAGWGLTGTLTSNTTGLITMRVIGDTYE